MKVECFAKRDGLHFPGPDGRARPDRMCARLQRLAIGVHDQVQIELRGHAVAMRDHVPELPGGIDMQRGEGNLGRMEGLAAQMQEDAGILADGIHQHRTLEGCCGLAQDNDSFCLKTGEVAR